MLTFIRRYSKMIDVVCAIIMKEHRILLCQRSERMTLPLKWEFPGGKIEKGESKEAALHRELWEELAIKVAIIGTLDSCEYDYGDLKIRLFPYIVHFISGEISLAEHRDYRWCRREELPRYDLAPADKPILAQFINKQRDRDDEGRII